ncbi:MAG: hypothetical protein KBT02_03760 [Treponema sp.]|nr:hypothetical protein [Candidatus Treponema caballi]
MKRVTVFLLLVALMCSVGFAEDMSFAEGTFVSGGFWSCEGNRSGGFGEFGFALVEESKNGFVLRDCITLGGYGNTVTDSNGMKFGEGIIGDKLMIGGVTDCSLFKVRSYGFMGAGIGLWGDETYGFAEGAPMLELSFGGGFEFQYAASTAFVIEFGGRCEGPVGSEKDRYQAYTNSSPLLTIGFRTLQ